MNKTQKFINKYFASYLLECKRQNPFFEAEENPHFPPTCEELEEIISYLIHNDVVPVIIGSIAVIKHLHIKNKDIKSGTFRLTNKLELFISDNLPLPPLHWQVKEGFEGRTSWISPIGSVVDFFNEEDIFLGDPENKFFFGKDSESVSEGCPVADVPTLFIIKLNTFEVRDIQDLLLLALEKGIPKNLDKLLLNSKQRKNLTFIKKWIQNDLARQSRCDLNNP